MKFSKWEGISAERDDLRGLYSLQDFWSFFNYLGPASDTFFRATPHSWEKLFAHYAKYNSHAIRKPGNKIQLYNLDSDSGILMTVAEQSPKNTFITSKICFVPAQLILFPQHTSCLTGFTSLLGSIDLYKRAIPI